MSDNVWVMDVETFVNCFTLVARKLESKSYLRFVLHFSKDDSEEMKTWLRTKPTLIGYNSLGFDAQVLQYMWDNDCYEPEKIYEFAQKVIEASKEGGKFALPYSEWNFTFNHIDLFSINHYGWGPRMTSLKWLEYTLRSQKMMDLPLSHDKPVSKSNVSRLLVYNRNDVDVTYEFYYKCLNMVELRQTLVNKYGERRIINMSDSSMGSYILRDAYSKKTGIKIQDLKSGTSRSEVNVAECILPYVQFTSPEFNEILTKYKNTIIYREKGKKAIELKGSIEGSTEFDGMTFDFGIGGLHGFRKPGVYRSSKTHTILSIDFTSFYPHLIFVNGIFPEHLGPIFCEVYKELYEQRKRYPKGTAENYAIKIAINGAYGKTNTEWDQFLRDPKVTVFTTVNGQFTMAMLAELLHKHGELLMVNTDGIEIRIERDKEQFIKDLLKDFEKKVGIPLEYNNYDLLACRDVNNYLAVDTKGDVKRKGVFEIYEDMIGEDGSPHQFHKKISYPIVPQAINDYFTKGTPIEETIYAGNNIHDYLVAVKKKSNFEYWLITADDSKRVSVDKRTERTIRYYISNDGGNLFKFYKDGRENNLQNAPGTSNVLVNLLLNVRHEEIKSLNKFGELKSNYPDLNYDYYIFETKSLLEIMPEL